MVPMNLEFVKDLWLPNIFIYNLKTYKVIMEIMIMKIMTCSLCLSVGDRRSVQAGWTVD